MKCVYLCMFEDNEHNQFTKIGCVHKKNRTLNQRMKEFENGGYTGYKYKYFECAISSANPQKTEKELHNQFGNCRVGNTELFCINSVMTFDKYIDAVMDKGEPLAPPHILSEL